MQVLVHHHRQNGLARRDAILVRADIAVRIIKILKGGINQRDLVQQLRGHDGGALVQFRLRVHRIALAADIADQIHHAALQRLPLGRADGPDGPAVLVVDEADLKTLLVGACRNDQEQRPHGSFRILQAIAQVQGQDLPVAGNLPFRRAARRDLHRAGDRRARQVAELDRFHHRLLLEHLSDLQHGRYGPERQASGFRAFAQQDMRSRIRHDNALVGQILLPGREVDHDGFTVFLRSLLVRRVSRQPARRDGGFAAEFRRPAAG